jgi:hypothetical protein
VLPLTPVDLLAIWERGAPQDPLDRAVTMLAGVSGISWNEAANTDVARRDAALVSALQILSGDPQIIGVLPCSGCGDLLDVPVDLTALPEPPPQSGEAVFVLPTSADLRQIRGMTPEAAKSALMSRCRRGPGAVDDQQWIAAMDAAAPISAMTIAAGCPGCGAVTRVDFDVSVLLWAEIERRALTLLSQVHLLASAYGWTESEVLSLGANRRAAYLRMAAVG